MGTLNAAEGYGLARKGALAPGFDADMIVVDNLRHFTVQQVYKKGVLVARNQEALFAVNTPDISRVSGSVKVGELSQESFRLKLRGDLVNVIHLHPGNLITEKAVRKVYIDEQGFFVHREKLDILKLAVIERHRGERKYRSWPGGRLPAEKRRAGYHNRP